MDFPRLRTCFDSPLGQPAASREFVDDFSIIPTRLRWPLLPTDRVRLYQLLRASRAQQRAASLPAIQLVSSRRSSTSSGTGNHPARSDQQWQQVMAIEATGREVEACFEIEVFSLQQLQLTRGESNQAVALFTEAATKKRMTKTTTKTATFPESNNCCLPGCKSRGEAAPHNQGSGPGRGGAFRREVRLCRPYKISTKQQSKRECR